MDRTRTLMARQSLRPQWVHDECIGRLVTAQTISGPARCLTSVSNSTRLLRRKTGMEQGDGSIAGPREAVALVRR